MSNPIFEAMNTASLMKDISERESIIKTYQEAGQLDREDVIQRFKNSVVEIKKLRWPHQLA